MADAIDSKSIEGNLMRVQLPPAALSQMTKNNKNLQAVVLISLQVRKISEKRE
jgi:hypothetical protein